MLEFRCLQQEELEAWFDHCMLVFNNGIIDYSFRQMFVDFWNNNPSHDLEGVRVAVEDTNILSSLRVISYEFYLAGEVVSMGGIATVSTIPYARGRGLATHLLQDGIQLMEVWGMKTSILATGIFSFYEKFGWKRVPIYHQTLQVTPVKEIASVRVRPLNFSRDLPAVEKIYHEYASRFNGPIVRSREYWDRLMKCAGNWWVAEIHQKNAAVTKIAACLRLIDDQEQVKVTEFSALESYDALFDLMVNDIFRQKKRTFEIITCPQVILSEFETLEVIAKDHLMLQLIHPFSVGTASVGTTDQLIDLVQGTEKPDPQTKVPKSTSFVFWETDGF